MLKYLFAYGKLRKYMGKSSGEVIAGLIKEPKLKSILLSVIPFIEPGAMAALLMNMFGSKEGMYYRRGGIQALADLLVRGLSKYDGELALNTMVNKIMIEDNKAIGAELADGSQVKAGYIVSNIDAKQTFLKLVGEEKLSPVLKKSDSNILIGLPFHVRPCWENIHDR